MFGSPDTMPGGKALKHACSCILKVTKLESSSHCISIQDDSGSERIIGKYSSVIIEKNRFAKPHFGSMKVPIYYEPYFPNIEDVCFNSGRDLKIIKVRNNIYSWKNIKTEGRSAFVEMIKNPEVIDELILIIKDEAKKQSMSLPIEIINFDISDYKKNSKKFINKKSISDEKEEIKNQVSEEVEDFDIDSNE
jgi:RecA/RadA recombinase